MILLWLVTSQPILDWNLNFHVRGPLNEWRVKLGSELQIKLVKRLKIFLSYDSWSQVAGLFLSASIVLY